MANTIPIFVKDTKNWFVPTGITQNTSLEGTGTVATLLTADATNGSQVNKIRIVHMGTNIATVLRIFVNNGSTNAIATNNALIKEVTIAANTLSQTAASLAYEIPMNLVLQAGYKLNVTIGTSIAAGLMVEAEGGDY